MTETRLSKLGFEIEDCSRCRGSGQYSYCEMYGSTCFKCGGRKWTYTKRGAAAKEYYESLNMVKRSDLKVGDVVWHDDNVISPSRWVKVIELPENGETVCDGIVFGNCDTFRIKPTEEQKQERLIKAREYQEKLTKNGTPRKVRS